jgi:histidinol-phosphatase (PHP family)
MEAMCQRAIETGLRAIAFTDHLDLEPEDEGFAFFQPDAYLAEVERCRSLFADPLTILSGIEVGEAHRFGQELTTLLGRHTFDMVIGSLHWIDGYLVFDPAYFQSRPIDQAYREYFVELVQMCCYGRFDVLGHLDIVKRVGAEAPDEFSVDRYEPEVRAVLDVLVDRNIALEINTSPLRSPVNQTSPTLTVLEWYREAGGELLTFGSDAHSVHDLGSGLSSAAELAQAAGFPSFASYQRHEPSLSPAEALS